MGGQLSPFTLNDKGIDSEKMYNIVMKWDWGNSGKPIIYHDPETRKNSISYRTNLARLMETLIIEGKKDKAEKVIDLAMEKMPIQYFELQLLNDPSQIVFSPHSSPQLPRRYRRSQDL